MKRKEITKFLTDILICDKFADRKYYALEPTINAGSNNAKRIDAMQFTPVNVFSTSGIEKGFFTCYEIKSCVGDVYSGNGLNFLGEENYIVTTMETYKKLLPDISSGFLTNYIKEHYPESLYHHYGIMVAVPSHIDCRKTKELHEEFENPTPLGGKPSDWKLYSIHKCRAGGRKRSLVEMLFCMLRAKHNYTNQKEDDTIGLDNNK